MDPAVAEEPVDQLARVLRRERGALVAAARRAGLSNEEALECVQEALCAWLAQSARAPVENEAALSALLRARVRNAARNRRRLHRLSRPHAALGPEHELVSHAANAETLLSAAETALRLKVCVAELREVERAVVMLRLLEERSGEDVAHALGLSRAHVDVLVHRAKQTLRACMQTPECGR